MTGDVTIAKLDLGGATPLTKVADIELGAGSEPWAVVIGNDDDTAFVITRKTQTIRKITGLKTTPSPTPRAASSGAGRPAADSPTGQEPYVANWAEGSVTVVKASDLHRQDHRPQRRSPSRACSARRSPRPPPASRPPPRARRHR
ncbi:MAG: hypothetical protein IPJ34_27860 [Myxococcales bacterium]|nr:hypothetical protein [Myxococcales bacterium]